MDEINEQLNEQEKLEENDLADNTAPIEQPVAEENKEELINQKLPSAKPIEKLGDDVSYVDLIEKERLKFAKIYNNSRRISYIMMAVVMLAAVGSVILITQKAMGFKIAGWSVIGAAIVGMLIYYIVTRNKVPNLTKDYIKLVNNAINGENFNHSDINEPVTDEKEKIELPEVSVEGLYKELGSIASRNVIHARYKGQAFTVADMGLYDRGQGRKRSSVFVGKYITEQNNLHFTDRFVVVLKGSQGVDQSNNLDDLEVLLQEDEMTIYGPKDADFKKIFGSKFIPALKKITLDDTLLNANFVFWAGHSSAYLSYCDEIMTLPFQNVYTGKANNKFKTDLYDTLDAFDLIK